MDGHISEELFHIFKTKTENDEKYYEQYEQIFTYLKDSKIMISFFLNKKNGNNFNQNTLIIIN